MGNFAARNSGTVNLLATTASGSTSVAIGSRPSIVRVFNSGTVPVFIEFSTLVGPTTAGAATAMPVSPGETRYVEKGLNDIATAVTLSGSATVYFTTGLGWVPFAGQPTVDPFTTPASLFAAGEQGAWYDPSDLTTIFQDSAGTIPANAIGQSIGMIKDKSGRGNHATQPTAANRPTLQSINSKNFLLFNGTNSAMFSSAVDFTGTSKMTVVMGIGKLDANPGMFLELSAAVNLNLGSFFVFTNNSTLNNIDVSMRGATGGTATRSYADGTPPIVSVLSINMDSTVTPIESAIDTRRNAVSVGNTGSTSSSTGAFGNYPLFLGARNGNNFFVNGRMYGLIVRGAASTAAQIIGTETFMNGRTGAY